MPFTMNMSRLRYLLLASLALNLVLGGIVAGAAFMRRPAPPPGDLVAGMVHALPDEARSALRRDFREHHKGNRDMRKLRVAQIEAISAAVAADPFDPAALESALTQFNRRTNEDLERLRGTLISEIGKLDADERAAFAEDLRRHAARRGAKGDHR